MIDELRERLHLATTRAQTTEEALDHTLGLHQEAAGLIDALRAFQADCKAAIGEIFVETGQIEAEGSMARCYVTAPSVRVSYDRKGLDELAGNDDELAAVLEPYRRETNVAGTLVVRAIKPK